MRYISFPVILAVLLTAGCSDRLASRTFVERTGPDELLKLRSGPGLEYNVILGLPDGTSLNRRECVTELGQRWCRVSLSDAPRISGYVSADYLSTN